MTEGTALEPLPPRLAELAALTGRRRLEPGERFTWPRAEELPEVRSLAARGFRPLGTAPLHCCLPAVWPEQHRCWVPDRLPKVSVGGDGSPTWIEPWDEQTRQEMAADIDREAAACGLPDPPRGRLWLLRSPWPSVGLEVLFVLLARRCEERDMLVMTPGVTEAARELLTWSEQQLWDWWSGPDADVARRWRARGRTGEEVARLVLAELGPDEIHAFAAGDPSLTEEQAVAWCGAIDAGGPESVAQVRAWLEAGLPANPPDDPHMVLARFEPEQVRQWLAAGFDLGDVAKLRGLPLESAIAWRERGFDPAEVRQLLQADWTVTPDEVAAFDAAGIGERERLRWLEDGFDADAARVWIDLDILPGEARVWRSVGQGPDDARRHREAGGGALPPRLRYIGFTAEGSADRANRRYGVTDPPGTRGRTAGQTRKGGRPPWRP